MSLTRLKSSMSSIISPSSPLKRRNRSTSSVRNSWKRRWLKRPVSSSVTAWRLIVSCRPTFSTESAAWLARKLNVSRSASENAAPSRAIVSTPTTPPSGCMSGRPSACSPPAVISAGSPERRTASSAAVIEAMAPPTSPARAASSSVPFTPWLRTTRPPPAWAFSTAVWTTTLSCVSRSMPLPTDSPTRWTAVRSSRSRAWICWAILLNSSPSWANSSWPSVGIATEKSPAPTCLAAATSCAVWRPSERAAVSAKASAEARKASRMRKIPSVLSDTASWPSGMSTWTPSMPPWSKSSVSKPVAR